MSISVPPELEATIRARAEAEGLPVDAYLSRLLQTEQLGMDELEAAAMEGLESGAPVEVGPFYWAEKHRRLDKAVKKHEKR